MVVVSCVETNHPYRCHPHNLVGKHCTSGVCRLDVQSDMTATFQNLGVQCVKRKDVKDSLMQREKIRVDPFRQKFDHATKGQIDLNAIRLCFQVFLTDRQPAGILAPIVSEPIFDRKAHGDLAIVNYR